MKSLESLAAKGKSAADFGLKDMVLGKRKTPQDQVVLKDPKTGKEVSTPDEIKRVSLEYCVDLLTAKEPPEKFADHINGLKHIHEERMKEKIDDDIDELPIDTFMKVFSELSKKPGLKYKFITKAGKSLHKAVLNLFQIVWKTENLPKGWQESTLIQLKKGKMEDNDLQDIRHIHDRAELGKYFSHIVMTEAKPKLFENMLKFQIACRPGHRPSEHL